MPRPPAANDAPPQPDVPPPERRGTHPAQSHGDVIAAGKGPDGEGPDGEGPDGEGPDGEEPDGDGAVGGWLVLLRHGQSVWNEEHRFTGWADPPLASTGQREAAAAGPALLAAGLHPDLVLTSVLRRAVQTVAVLREAGRTVDVRQDWRLNERHYGVLEGLTHTDGRLHYGPARIAVWRRSWLHGPPPLPAGDPRHPRADPRYRQVPDGQLPAGESLAQTLQRSWPAVQQHALPVLQTGGTVLLVGHGNALRALSAHLEQLTAHQVHHLVLPTGVPRPYRWQHGRWTPGPELGVTGTLSGP